jgi:chromosome segregation ATPase
MRTFLSFLICSFILLTHMQGFARSEQDSLRLKRTELISQYIELISNPRRSPGVERQIFDLQNRIITVDNVLLEDFFDNAITARENALRDLQVEYERNKELEKKIEDMNSAGILIIIVLVVLLMITLAIITFLAMRIKKHRRKLGFIENDKALIKIQRDNILKLKEELEELRKTTPVEGDPESEKLKEKIAEYEKKAGESHVQLIQLKSEKRQLEEKMNQLQTEGVHQSPESIAAAEQNQEEMLHLKNQLDESQRNIEELSQQNKILGDELQNYIEKEQNYQAEIEKIGNELSQTLQQKEEIQRELEGSRDGLINTEFSDSDQTTEIEKLNQKIEIYKERLAAEENARNDFEKQINQILDDYKKYIDKLFENE